MGRPGSGAALQHLDVLEAQTISSLREAYHRVKPLGLRGSLGKDSNALLWMARTAFLGGLPFPAILLDTGNELDEADALRDRYVREWNLASINAGCPRRGDRPVAAAGRARRRPQEARSQAPDRAGGLPRHPARHPAR